MKTTLTNARVLELKNYSKHQLSKDIKMPPEPLITVVGFLNLRRYQLTNLRDKVLDMPPIDKIILSRRFYSLIEQINNDIRSI